MGDSKVRSIVVGLATAAVYLGCSSGSGTNSNNSNPPFCPTTTTGPTVHSADVASSQTWTAAASPHVVTQGISVLAGATLTIEACASVQLAAGASIDVHGGTLLAQGTADKPITFGAKDPMPWNNLRVDYPGTASLAYATLSGGGGQTTFEEGATLVISATNPVSSVAPLVKVDHVTIQGSVGFGVLGDVFGGFTADSQQLIITGCGKGLAASPYPISMYFSPAGTVPSGTYTGNQVDEIQVRTGPAVAESFTLHARGVPYRMEGGSSASYAVASATLGGTPAVLTIEAGVTLRFGSGARLTIGGGANADPAMGFPGTLIAVGTASSPIVFTSSSATPAAGDWVGLEFAATTTPGNDLEYVSIDYAGGPCSCSGFSCLPMGTDDNAALKIFNWDPPASFLTNSSILHSAGHGVIRGWSAATGPDFLPSNTFDVAECKETPFRDQYGHCPDPPPCP